MCTHMGKVQATPSLSPIFDQLAQEAHEQVVYCYDEATSLKAIIAIHNTLLGPALGGTRIFHYTYEQDALTDVLRLSAGMTYKAALADLKLGGGKAVIIGDVRQVKNEHLLIKYGQFIHGLHGRYITAPDVNTNMQDMTVIARATPHVQSLPTAQGGSGDPSPFTAYGAYLGIKAAVKHAYGHDCLHNKKIGVEGVGKVGAHLVAYLCKEKAQVYVTDIVQDKLTSISQQYQVNIVPPDQFHAFPLDVYAPCALGATLNDATIARLQCSIIVGAANNQLADNKRHSRMLFERGILYVPDFLVNSGGLINVHTDLYHAYSGDLAYQHVERIYATCLAILDKSAKARVAPLVLAEQIAEERLRNAQKS